MSMKTLIFTLALAVMATSSFGRVVIDDFTVVGTSDDVDDGGFAFDPSATFGPVNINEREFLSGINPDNTVGGDRYLEVDLDMGDSTGDTVIGQVNAVSEQATFASDTGAVGVSSLRYGVDASGVPAVAEQLDSNFNVNAGGDPAPFTRINVGVASDAPGTLSITLIEDIDGANRVATVFHDFPDTFEAFVNLKFFNFQFLADNPTMTFSDIDAILVTLNGTASGDYDISFLDTIPEPASASLLVLGALGLMGRRRRQS